MQIQEQLFKNTPVPTDHFNREIHIGDHVAYAVRDGNVAKMNDGVVRDIEYKREGYGSEKLVPVLVMDTKRWDWKTKEFVPSTSRLWMYKRSVIVRSLSQGGN
jgi:hypothetical protein